MVPPSSGVLRSLPDLQPHSTLRKLGSPILDAGTRVPRVQKQWSSCCPLRVPPGPRPARWPLPWKTSTRGVTPRGLTAWLIEGQADRRTDRWTDRDRGGSVGAGEQWGWEERGVGEGGCGSQKPRGSPASCCDPQWRRLRCCLSLSPDGPRALKCTARVWALDPAPSPTRRGAQGRVSPTVAPSSAPVGP